MPYLTPERLAKRVYRNPMLGVELKNRYTADMTYIFAGQTVFLPLPEDIIKTSPRPASFLLNTKEGNESFLALLAERNKDIT